MSKSLKKNYLYNLAYQILLVIAPIITTPYVSRTLGAGNIGIYGFTVSITTYFILIGSLGINLYGQREIAYARSNKEKLNQVFWSLFILKALSLVVSMAVFFAAFASGGEYAIYYRILLLELVANLLDVSWLYQGMEEFKQTATRNIIIKILSVISILVFVKTENDLNIYFIIYALTVLFGSLVLWPGARKYISKPNGIVIRPHIKPALAMFLPQVAIQVYTVLDKTMIGWITNDMEQVGYYEQTQKIVKIVLALITSLGIVMLPRIANYFADGKKEEIGAYIKKTTNFILLFAIPMMFGMVAVAPKFVPLFFGDGYDPAILLMQITSPIILFIGLSNVFGTQYLLPTKQQTKYTISIIVGMVINVIFNSIFINLWGAVGAALSTALAEMAVMLAQVWFTRKDFNAKDIFAPAIKYLLFGAIMFAVCFCIDRFVQGSNIFVISLQIMAGAATYFILLVASRDKFLLDEINGVANKIRRR